MPAITLSHTPLDGQTADGPGLDTDFYTAASTPDSFEVINGRLDSDNIDSSVLASGLDGSVIQNGACSGGRAVGATNELDYFAKGGMLFSNWEADDNDDSSSYRVIPGAATSFYLPYDASLVVYSWNIFLDPSGSRYTTNYPDPLIRLRLFIDGTQVAYVRHDLTTGQTGPKLDIGTIDHGNDGMEWSRLWCGHHMVTSTTTKGWHSASIRVAMVDTSHVLCRVKCRSINYTYFR